MARFYTLPLILLLSALPAQAQTLNVTFRYLPTGVVERAFVPGQIVGQSGSFTNWGQPYNASNCIAAGNVSEMQFVRFQNYWAKTFALPVGARLEYKIQVHRNTSGTQCTWLSDPLNPLTNPSNNSNSVLDVVDPMVFQPAEEPGASVGLVGHFSAGLFSTQPITAITYTVNGVVRTDGLTHFDAATGVFRYRLDREVRSGAQFIVEATDAGGRTMRAEIGTLQPPIAWLTGPFTAFTETATLRASVTRLDGSVDPSVTEATVYAFGNAIGTAPVTNGAITAEVPLVVGPNVFALEATVEGATYRTADLQVVRRTHPLQGFLVDPAVSGTGFAFTIDLVPTGAGPSPDATFTVDERLSTTTVSGFAAAGLQATGTAAGPGEIFVDVAITAGALTDRQRVAVLVGDDGTARTMAWAENAAWTKKAVVYEVFPLTFGPRAAGTPASPGPRLDQITAELDYIAAMGFNTIWFMPIMHNQSMDPVSGGYNIKDFYTVDPTIGTNDDFRALVDRAHELGLRVILDWTPNHVSPVHPWVQSLREGGPFASYLQTTPSSHARGLDGRGANLPEIWQTEGGANFYRKYDGFGDLANLDWDDDGLQAEMLDVVAYWMNEFAIDGWRFDVYWGPWRRYGPERFGRPIRELVKRIRPDAWLLGEIEGTGGGTEVYYADDDFGTPVEGGLDAAYDWTFYFSGIRGSYADLSGYHSRIANGNFWPGPNARFFRFLENHDEPRIAWVHRTNLDRTKPLAGMLLTTTGVPMVYAGQEVAFGTGSDYDQRAVVDWNTPRNGEFAAMYQRLAHVRTRFPAFWTQRVTSIYQGVAVRQDRVYAYVRPYPEENAVVAVNFENRPVTVTINPKAALDWSTDGPIPYYDVFADTVRAYVGAFTITVPAYETVVYITSSAPGYTAPTLPALPYGAVYTGVEEGGEPGELPRSVDLGAAWPNPFNPVTRLAFELPASGPVRLDVFDAVGRRVATLADGLHPAGRHEAVFDASSLPSGVYFARLQAGAEVRTRSLVLVK